MTVKVAVEVAVRVAATLSKSRDAAVLPRLATPERENDELCQKLALSSAEVEVLSEVLSRKNA